MSAYLEPAEGGGRFRVSGELVFATVPALDLQSRQLFTGASPLHIDLGGVTHADSAGVALLIEWAARAREAGRQVEFRSVPAQMCELVRVSGLAEVLPLAASE